MMNDGRGAERFAGGSSCLCDATAPSGAGIIVNADDWGRDVATTGRSLDCVLRGAVSSVSAMVFMEDSERAAHLALLHRVDTGLHLNLTMPFYAPHSSSLLRAHQKKLSRFLTANRWAPLLYHPGLAGSFEYVVKAQLEEYERLYGAPANRVDGHHHMHLATNVVMQELLPDNIIVRRNLTFGPKEKGYFNRLYRRRQDLRLARRHRMADFFFDLQPLEPRRRLVDIFDLAASFDIEVETHPIREEEYRFLISEELFHCAGQAGVVRDYVLRIRNDGTGGRSAA